MGQGQPAIEVEVQHYAGVLRQAIRAAGLSVSEVERRLGTGPKALRRVFGGSVDLKFKHVVAVLRVIGMSQEEFFAIATRRRPRPRSAGRQFLATFERIGYRGEFVPLPEDTENPATEEEFDRLVEDAVDRVMRRRDETTGSRALKPEATRPAGTKPAEKAGAEPAKPPEPEPGPPAGDEEST